MSKPKAIATAGILFAMIVIMLGSFGYLLIEDSKVLAIFIAAVTAFAAWISHESYRSQVKAITMENRNPGTEVRHMRTTARNHTSR